MSNGGRRQGREREGGRERERERGGREGDMAVWPAYVPWFGGGQHFYSPHLGGPHGCDE